jgi:hypothetical protein
MKTSDLTRLKLYISLAHLSFDTSAFFIKYFMVSGVSTESMQEQNKLGRRRLLGVVISKACQI